MIEVRRTSKLYGLVAEFTTPERVVEAANHARLTGYTRMEAHSPVPVEGLAEAIGFRRNRIPQLVFIGGLLGGIGGFLLQWYTSTESYPLNIGGKPLNSWPGFLPVTFECTVLGAALTAVFGMLALNGLPMPYHPLFSVPGFERASSDRFFLFIRGDDPLFDREQTRQLLHELNPESLHEVMD